MLSFCAVLLASACIGETIEFDLEPGERWWGGSVGSGGEMPFSGKTVFGSTLVGNPGGNQVVGLFLSSRGRCLWSDAPFDYAFSNGHFRARGPAPLRLDAAGERTLRGARELAVKKYMPPSGRCPDEMLFTAPQWNTWIELTYNQNERDIRAYADSILSHGFPPCVIMIDDTWQEGYGVWRFNPARFPDPKGMCDYLHSRGFKVMLWVVPYVSPDTPEFRELRDAKGLLMDAERRGECAIFPWWNGYSAAIDLSSGGGVAWFRGRLDSLCRDYGIDGFKFDGGSMSVYSKRRFKAEDPRASTSEAQARLYGEFALGYPLAEVKSTWQMGNSPLAQRLRDKHHRWRDVARCIADMNAAQLLGYQYCAPDMIGGGEWQSFRPGAKFSKKLVVRYAQAAALMPAMQFSLDPWRVMKDPGDEKYLDAVTKAVKVRESHMPKILKLVRNAAEKGTPITCPMDYAFPWQGFEDVQDQFVLGDDLIVAPIVDDTDSRTVRLPAGRWIDDLGHAVEGPAIIQLKDVPVDRLPRWTLSGHPLAAPCEKKSKYPLATASPI